MGLLPDFNRGSSRFFEATWIAIEALLFFLDSRFELETIDYTFVYRNESIGDECER